MCKVSCDIEHSFRYKKVSSYISFMTFCDQILVELVIRQRLQLP